MQDSWKPHGTGGIGKIPLKKHLELIGRKPRRSRAEESEAVLPIALVHNVWTGVKTYSTCGKAFASRDDATRFRERMSNMHGTQSIDVETSRVTTCGPECLPCAYGMHGTCTNTRQSSVHALRVAGALSATATAAYTEELPTVTISACSTSASRTSVTTRSQPHMQEALEENEAFMHAMDLVRGQVHGQSASYGSDDFRYN